LAGFITIYWLFGIGLLFGWDTRERVTTAWEGHKRAIVRS